MASTSWGTEPGSDFPRVTIYLDAPTYSGINAVGIVGAPFYQGMQVQIVFMSMDSARGSMQTVLEQLKGIGSIRGSVYDNETGASVH